MRCPACGGLIDCRDLSQEIAHDGPLPHPAAEGPHKLTASFSVAARSWHSLSVRGVFGRCANLAGFCFNGVARRKPRKQHHGTERHKSDYYSDYYKSEIAIPMVAVRLL